MCKIHRFVIQILCLLVLLCSCEINTSDLGHNDTLEPISSVENSKNFVDKYIDSHSGNYRYTIIDTDNLKDNLIGKYVSIKNPDIYFEIKDDVAILHKSFAEYAVFEPNDNTEMLVLHIEKTDDGARLLFVHKYCDTDFLNGIEFIFIEKENKFIWYTDNDMYYFEKTEDSAMS